MKNRPFVFRLYSSTSKKKKSGFVLSVLHGISLPPRHWWDTNNSHDIFQILGPFIETLNDQDQILRGVAYIYLTSVLSNNSTLFPLSCWCIYSNNTTRQSGTNLFHAQEFHTQSHIWRVMVGKVVCNKVILNLIWRISIQHPPKWSTIMESCNNISPSFSSSQSKVIAGNSKGRS